jgi:hypothetical protein
MSTLLDAEREKFEQYLRKKHERQDGWFLWVHGDAAHSYVYTQPEWEAWQAASAGRQALLEACEEALGALNGAEHALPGYVVAALERAIAKATGEQQ